MIETVGWISIVAAFAASVGSLIIYFLAAKKIGLATSVSSLERTAHILFATKTLLILVASIALVLLLFDHRFDIFYVYNYTSTDLPSVYLWAAFYSGQEGSFLLWILMGGLVGLALIKWTSTEYRAPVMFFFTITQFFLLSMIVGIPLGDITLGASPFRTTASEFAHLPVFQNNPDFVPAEGSGLNDLLRSPWIVIHPPVIFLGFAMMAIPFAYALASLWKRYYHEWIYPAFPWTLGANLCLLVAIFLGGYWAYETLSFGGYWAWDPVENASLVPWIFGMAGIHTMLVQRKSATSHKASIIFAVLAYATIVYQTFLTRSGVLGDASVHSFVDLGLYNQLLIFMLTITIIGFSMVAWRFNELPSQEKESPYLSREFLLFAGAMTLFLTGLVIIVGTSSPIIGRLFVPNPTPPEPSFYNMWTLPFGILIAVLTVLAQYMWWNKYKDADSFSGALLKPVIAASVLSVIAIMWFDIRNVAYMAYLFAAIFALIGNGAMMIKLARRKTKLIGGTLTHIGFALLLIGFLGAAYDVPMLDRETKQYNQAVAAGIVTDDEGFQVRQPIELVRLVRNEPKIINDQYKVTYIDVEIAHDNRPGEQTYQIRFENIDNGRTFDLFPVTYPMIANSSPGNMSWTVDPEVNMGLARDLYVYVAGSALINRENKRIENASSFQAVADVLMNEDYGREQTQFDHISMSVGSTVTVGQYEFKFNRFINVDESELPEGAIVGVKADLTVTNTTDYTEENITPMYALVVQDGENLVSTRPAGLSDGEKVVTFSHIDIHSDRIHLELDGFEDEGLPDTEEDWIFITMESKPLVSVVWLGTFVLMAGFSVSIFRRWSDHKKRERRKDKNLTDENDDLD